MLLVTPRALLKAESKRYWLLYCSRVGVGKRPGFFTLNFAKMPKKRKVAKMWDVSVNDINVVCEHASDNFEGDKI